MYIYVYMYMYIVSQDEDSGLKMETNESCARCFCLTVWLRPIWSLSHCADLWRDRHLKELGATLFLFSEPCSDREHPLLLPFHWCATVPLFCLSFFSFSRMPTHADSIIIVKSCHFLMLIVAVFLHSQNLTNAQWCWKVY